MKKGGNLRPEVVMLLMLYAVIILLYTIITRYHRDDEPNWDAITPVRVEAVEDGEDDEYIDAIGQPSKGLQTETEREETPKERLIRETGERLNQAFGLRDVD